MELTIVLKKPQGTINGLGYWTLGWEAMIDGKKHAEYWPISPPRRDKIAALNGEARKRFENYNKRYAT